MDPVTGVNRRAYSCRHYYATQSLYDGVPVAATVANMGTSLRMIDDHYGHVLADMQSVVLTQPKARDVLDRGRMVAARQAPSARMPPPPLADDQPWIADEAAPWSAHDEAADAMS